MRPGAALFAGTFVGALLGYAFFVVLGRSLSPDDLGAVGSLINVSTILGVPGLGIQLVTARGVAARPGAGGGAGPHLPLARHGARALGAALLVGLALTAVLALGSPLLAWLLHLPVPAVLALALSAVPMTVSMAGFGMLQGSELFAGLGLASLMVGVTKLSAALLASALGLGVLGVMVAYSLGWLVTALLTLALVARGTGASVLPSPGAPVARAVARAAREGLVGALPTAGLLVLSSLDLIVARHHLPAAASGAYTIGALFEKVAFWGPQFLATLSYPRFARPAERPAALRTALLLTAAVGLAGVLATSALGGPLVRLVAGTGYPSLGPQAWLFTALGAALALVQVLVYADLAVGGSRVGVAVWCAAALAVVGVAMSHASTGAVVTVMLVTVLVLLAVAGALTARPRPAVADPVL
ncbi:hypothetical protein [Arsenicicoccus piscis]|uniref:Polysaccharide biosynthesis protein n=1 Tax=Arsenicicoccus piscis TaxID=673954 RepID=A0ABQ6HNH3_9MICO|nr:hypothetical protein [Arsenicicoccus piscis]GMA19702.1 hypothetical protein GCM10025862_17230 [Arsenicicoccus piscis]